MPDQDRDLAVISARVAARLDVMLMLLDIRDGFEVSHRALARARDRYGIDIDTTTGRISRAPAVTIWSS